MKMMKIFHIVIFMFRSSFNIKYLDTNIAKLGEDGGMTTLIVLMVNK